MWLLCESFAMLLYLDFAIRRGGFRSLHRLVREQPLLPPRPTRTTVKVCRTMDFACALYFRQVACLQRSAATVLLLRRCGCRAEMVIGVQLVPFKSHAWVEVDGNIVNDKPYMSEIYRELERC